MAVEVHFENGNSIDVPDGVQATWTQKKLEREAETTSLAPFLSISDKDHNVVAEFRLDVIVGYKIYELT